jgi:hypothetical protein
MELRTHFDLRDVSTDMASFAVILSALSTLGVPLAERPAIVPTAQVRIKRLPRWVTPLACASARHRMIC